MEWIAGEGYSSKKERKVLEEARKRGMMTLPRPEIWISHLVASTLSKPGKMSESDYINDYLKKNHAYRTSNLTEKVVFPKNALLLPVSQKDSPFSLDDFNPITRSLRDDYLLEIKRPSTLDGFLSSLQRLFSGRYLPPIPVAPRRGRTYNCPDSRPTLCLRPSLVRSEPLSVCIDLGRSDPTALRCAQR